MDNEVINKVEKLLQEMIKGHPYPEKLLIDWKNGHAILDAFHDLQAENDRLREALA